RMASMIHDLGKISVPAEILSRPGRLSEIEFDLIKQHSKTGYEILKNIEFPWPIDRIVLQHHERMNGSGYPAGLCSGDIILEAKILGVADVVEAMASHRPYRPALGVDKALEEISKHKGILYDPGVVETCLTLFREKAFDFD
ncbi:MAG: HD domain-containing phosphohydrolase, partial [Pseudomonadota bacterium]